MKKLTIKEIGVLLTAKNTYGLLKACGLTCKQVLKNLYADQFLTMEKPTCEIVRWFCQNVLLFNNFGNKILK